ncbi:MAG: Rieske 2Fe-2S domain-containing protein [Elusimicrobia bacterium]|nr:Rieske 2Fe-2S domain-containing protein [Elusimicrobiota bacterium]
MAVFNNPEVVAQGWYLAALSKEVGRGRAVSRTLLDRKLAVYRGDDGIARVLEGRCAHLGADLGRGCVVGETLRCEFHHWRYGPDGRCAQIPGQTEIPAFARVFAYPAREEHGGVWFFNGPQPLFDLPGFPGLRAVALKPQTLRCHPHVVACNGLDVQHFKTVHGFEFSQPPELSEPGARSVRLSLRIRLSGKSASERALRLVTGPELSADFTTYGGNLATIDGRAGRFPVRVLFSHRPLPGGGSASRTFLFFEKRSPAAEAASRLVLGYILAGDRPMFDALEFRARPTPEDAPLAAFIRQVNKLPVFAPPSNAEPA